jgi:hypothetical protein
MSAARRSLLAVPLALAAVTFGAVTACGPFGGSGNGSASAPASADPLEQGRKFAQCMRDQGVDLPDPGSGGGFQTPKPGKPLLDPKSPTVKAALEACKSLDPNSGGDAQPPIDPTQLAQMLEFAKCMREHGIDMPDPGANGGHQTPNSNPDNPALKVAGEACKGKVPSDVSTAFGPDNK